MAINKVIYSGNTLIDLTGDTVTSDTLFEGVTAHNAEGEPVTGNFPNGEIDVQAELIEQIKSSLENKASGGGDSALPNGYSRVDYIQFTGEQTIDTGCICNQNTKLQVGFTRERSSQHYLYGVASSDNKASVTAYLGGSWRFGDKSVTKTITTNADMIYNAVVDNSKISVTGSSSAISAVNEFETVGTLQLGGCRNSSGTDGSPQFEGKILFFIIWQGDEQILKLVPVANGNGVYRFYDEVSGDFFDSITDTELSGGNL